ncbi:MAG: hypothetical protein LBR10_11685 [Prevotellaceae bacterium]|jgi:hypothetical protein|nr:hypothetical protein [Prevotellaceae bacterium]
MKVSGFSFIRNAVRYDYPVVEAIQSVLPLCDEFVIAVGKSDDDTLGLIRGISSPKIRIVETVWDDSLRSGGAVLAQETNKAFNAVSDDADWAFYIQGDEILHEQYHDTVRREMLRWKDDSDVDGLLFHYRHFYGSYDYVGIAPWWYRNEIRIIRKNRNIYSYRDAQGFRKGENKKLNVKPIDAYIYHYGWVKHPKNMQQKINGFVRLYHDDARLEDNVAKADEFDYSNIDALSRFDGTHPKVMTDRISRINWKFDHDLKKTNLSLKYRFKMLVEKLTGYRIFEYKNYRII